MTDMIASGASRDGVVGARRGARITSAVGLKARQDSTELAIQDILTSSSLMIPGCARDCSVSPLRCDWVLSDRIHEPHMGSVIDHMLWLFITCPETYLDLQTTLMYLNPTTSPRRLVGDVIKRTVGHGSER